MSDVSVTTFSWSMRICSSGFSRANSPKVPKPALLTRTSIVTLRSASVRATSSAAPGSERSCASTVAVMLWARDSSSASACSFGAVRARRTTSRPPAAINRARSSPIPPDAPVTSATSRIDAIVQSLTESYGGNGFATKERRRTETLNGAPRGYKMTAIPADRSRPRGRDRVGHRQPADCAPVLFVRLRSLRCLRVESVASVPSVTTQQLTSNRRRPPRRSPRAGPRPEGSRPRRSCARGDGRRTSGRRRRSSSGTRSCRRGRRRSERPD